jgi:cyanophycin synthetase
MKIVEMRVLRGPNLFARRPVIQAVVDLEQLDELPSSAIDGFSARLLQMLPGIRHHRCGVGYEGGFVDRLHEGTYMAHIAEHLMLELQALAGDDIKYGHTRMQRGRPRHYRIVVGYAVEAVALRALAQAVRLVEAAAAGQLLDTAAMVDELRALRRRHGLGPSTQAIVDAARARGIPVLRLTDDASLLQLGWGARQQRVQATVTGQTGHIGVTIACDKALTKQQLERAGIPVPAGRVVDSQEEALAAAEALGWPVICKPLDGNQGKGVTTGVATPEALAAAFELARRHGARLLVERHVRGFDHRVLVVGGRVVAAARRLPPQVHGDGRSSVRALVDALNADPRRGVDHEAPLTRVALDDAALACLAAQKVVESKPPE